jgi:type III restriction enzyme
MRLCNLRFFSVGTELSKIQRNSTDELDYLIDVSDLDIDRQFQEAGRKLGNGLHLEYRKAHEQRDALEVKLELIIASRTPSTLVALEQRSKGAFNALFDRHRSEIRKLRETKRRAYERLRAASTVPEALDWHLQDTIDFRRDPTSSTWERHLFIEEDGTFRADLGTWEAGVVIEELKRPDTIGWLRNVDRKPWSLEIPYQTGGIARPMFPDMLMVRKEGKDFRFDILEPHDPSLADNLEKAKGLADFAEKRGDVFSRIQLIRKQGSRFARLELNRSAIRDKLRLVTSNAQIDDLFASAAGTT